MVSHIILLAAFVLFGMTQVSSDAQIENEASQEVKEANRRLLEFVDCAGLRKVRCSLHSRPNVCTRACGTCCARCNCVPPGTYGDRERCGRCYADMTTHGNKTKCP